MTAEESIFKNNLWLIKLDNGKVKVGERALDFVGNLKVKYEANNKDYQGIYKKQLQIREDFMRRGSNPLLYLYQSLN